MAIKPARITKAQPAISISFGYAVMVLSNNPNSATAATRRGDCNQSAMAGFAAAYG